MDSICIQKCIPLTYSDLPKVLALEKQYTSNTWNISQFATVLKQKGYKIFGIQTCCKKLIGYIFIYYNQDYLEIINIVVEKQMQRKGYGKLLLNTALRLAIKKGILEIMLEVRATNNSAIAFYKNFGFIQTGIRKKYYSNTNEDALIYSKQITSGTL